MSNLTLVLGLLQAGITTVEITVGAWIVGTMLGLLLAVIRDIGALPIKVSLESTVTILRSVPQLVALYLMFFGLGAIGIQLNPIVAAILALGVTDAAFAAEYYRAGFMTVPIAQRDAGLSLGLSSLGTLRLVILPQTLLFVIPPLLNQFVGLLKLATLASAIGAPEILYRGEDDINVTGQVVYVAIVIAALYVGVTMPLTLLVANLERRLRKALNN
jgi:His/Glu/Gln/Arg/opine family amino acid ABC transporter permease subunit